MFQSTSHGPQGRAHMSFNPPNRGHAMRTRTFYTTISLLTIGLLSGCTSTNTLASRPMTSSIALGAMESTDDLHMDITSGSPLCLSSGDDLGYSMWVWQVALAPEQDEELLVAAELE